LFYLQDNNSTEENPMAKVSVFHNLHRDAGLGLNTKLVRSTYAPEGIERVSELGDGTFCWREYEPIRHPLAWVFQYEAKGFATDEELLYDAFEMFNIGEGPVALEYRGRKLRSLSVGDVIAIDGRHYACAPVGWKEVPRSEIRWMAARQAEEYARERYGFRPNEPLTISVPLPD